MNAPIRPNSPSARDIASVLHPYTDLEAHLRTGPLVITRGKGVRVWDEAGREYIDTLAGLWCTALGFDNERLVEAAVRQMRALPFYHAFGGRSHPPMIELAEMLLARAPVPMSRVFFANSGSEANDTAIKMIWYANNVWGRPEKKKIIGRVRGYHGITIAAGSVTGQTINHKGFDLPLPGFLHLRCPTYYHEGLPGETEEQFSQRLAEELEALILREGPETIAAMFAEPVQGAGGVVVPPRGYFEAIQPILRKYDILLVADEVICGFGRTGNYWGSQTFGLEPDLLVCAKALSNAYLPISAVMVNDRLFQALAKQSHEIGSFGHGFTYSGHPVPAAVAVETLKIYDEIDIVGKVREVGPYFQAQLRERFADHPLVGEVRGVGLIAGVELVEDKEARRNFAPARKIGPRLVKHAEEHGLICRAMVFDTIGFSPPLIISRAEIDELLDRFGRALDDLAAVLAEERETTMA